MQLTTSMGVVEYLREFQTHLSIMALSIGKTSEVP